MTLRATITSVNGDSAMLALQNGQSVSVPVAAIEGTPKPGQEVRGVFVTPGGEDAARQRIARDLLNELLSA